MCARPDRERWAPAQAKGGERARVSPRSGFALVLAAGRPVFRAWSTTPRSSHSENHMRYTLQHLLLALTFLGLPSCQGRGRVHETPPATYPSARPAASSPDRGVGAFEAPADDVGHARPAFPSPSRAEPAPSAPPAAERSASGRFDLGGAAQRRAPAANEGEWQGWRDRELERPGLATHWGEARYSPTREVDFQRADFTRPCAVLELHYNDRRGAFDMLPGGSWGKSEIRALGGAVEVAMVDASGRPYSALRSGDRVIAVGDPGERYALLVQNRGPERFEIVATVDGLDVLDGEDGSFEKRGYLLGAYSSVMIDGFRRSDAEVAAFRLGDVARSYAASKGKARNVGVIGIALFDEERPRAYHPPYRQERRREDDTYERRTAEPFPGRYARPPVW